MEHAGQELEAELSPGAGPRYNQATMAAPRCTAPCTPPCPRRVLKKGLCGGHYQRKLRHRPIDTPLRTRQVGEPVPVRLPDEERAAFEREARVRGVRVSDLLRAAARTWLSLPEAERRAVLAGLKPRRAGR